MKSKLSITAAALWALAAMDAQAQDAPYEGMYAGLGVSHHTAIGGALVGGVDMLAQDQVGAVGISGGYRWQRGSFVFGGEGEFGYEDGNLSLSDPVNALEITYDNAVYWRYGALAGVAFGDDGQTLVYAYLNETKRNYNVTVVNAGNSVQQRDGQGLVGYGIGVERPFAGSLWRLRVGTTDPEYSGTTNIDPDTNVDVSFGFARQY